MKVARLTRWYEATEAKLWKMSESMTEFIDSMLRSIVGIEIAVTSLVGKRKLSQNREARDRLSAAETFEQRGNIELGHYMRETE